MAILDADKEGFLRSPRSLVQVAGRAARNVNGRVIMYGERVTPAMQHLLDETARRRKKQIAYNEEHGIEPRTVAKSARQSIADIIAPEKRDVEYTRDDSHRQVFSVAEASGVYTTEVLSESEMDALTAELEKEMLEAAEALEFERAADLRDRLRRLNKL